MKFKEKFIKWFGNFGGVLYLIFMLILFTMPIAMINVSFDLPFWVSPIMIAVLFLISSIANIYWIVGFIGVIMGPQDVIAIIYYVFFAIIFLPNVILLLLNLCSRAK